MLPYTINSHCYPLVHETFDNLHLIDIEHALGSVHVCLHNCALRLLLAHEAVVPPDRRSKRSGSNWCSPGEQALTST